MIGVSEGAVVIPRGKLVLLVDVNTAISSAALALGVLVGVGVNSGSCIQPTTTELTSTSNDTRKRICNQARPALFSTNL